MAYLIFTKNQASEARKKSFDFINSLKTILKIVKEIVQVAVSA